MKKMTATTAAANAVIEVTGKGWLKFNDKLKDGKRSLKVLGWTQKEYEMAQYILDMAGHETELVEFAGNSYRFNVCYKQMRLHVKEAY